MEHATVESALEMKNIVKEFPGVRALKNVNFAANRGEVHGLVGENGAGKSTLMKVLSGVHPYPTYSGELVVEGKSVRFSGTREAEHAGIAIIHQELNLIADLTVAENIFLGREPLLRPLRFIDRAKIVADTRVLLKSLNFDINPNTVIRDLSVGKQQMVEIAKALSCEARILVLDEPTSALTGAEIENLFRIIRDLKERNVTMIYISHKIDEVFEICDPITILRDGETVGTFRTQELTREKLISLMVGRDLTNLYPPREPHIGDEALRVENFYVDHPFLPGEKIVRNISFTARHGEIVGVAGLMGSGRSELVTAMFGAFPADVSGRIYINKKNVQIRSPLGAINNGVGLVTEDRKRFGLVLSMSVCDNISLASLGIVSKWCFVDRGLETKLVDRYIRELSIKTAGRGLLVTTLSGGNQQKVVISKWLATTPKILILDEPTRGVDVGARYEIYQIMNKLVSEGVCIVMVSSDLPEILGMSDRILVMHQGELTGEFQRNEATQETIMACATGQKKHLRSA
ncbi:MAG: ATP-binding cassette domain-containing protein [bacterium]